MKTASKLSECLRRSFTFPFLLASIIFGAAAAGETTLNQPWSARSFVAANAPFRNVLVIAVTNEKENRLLLENAFVDQIKKTKSDAISSASIMHADEEVTAEAVKAAVADSGKKFDVALMSYLYRVDEVDVVNITDPGTKRSERDFALALWGDWQNARDFVLDAGVTGRRQYVVEHSLFYMDNAEQIWTVQSRSMDPKSAEELINSISELVTESLVSAELF